ILHKKIVQLISRSLKNSVFEDNFAPRAFSSSSARSSYVSYASLKRLTRKSTPHQNSLRNQFMTRNKKLYFLVTRTDKSICTG
ncbi:MAG TPA: hypothetical protein PKD15_06105, partial [Candidatus Saccharibacteria bacterium]|nr:hypothetical protein [Candidatus Saccharibacteria bacterium]